MDPKEQRSARSPRPRRYLPGTGVCITLLLCSLAILFTRAFHDSIEELFPSFDDAFLNLTTLILGFIAALTLFVWFVSFSAYPRLVRLGTFLGVPLAIAVFFFFYQVAEVTGNMVPRFVRRGTKPADAKLAAVKSEVKAADIPKGPAAADYPQFLGPDRNNYLSGPELSGDWNARPPKEIWRRPIGAGWSAFSVAGGYAVTLEQRGEDEWVTCYEAASGKPVWGDRIAARHENTLGGIGPRSTPTIDGGKVYALGGTGVLRCLDFATGKLLWKQDLLARYGLEQVQAEEIVMWGRSASPLVVDGLVIVPAGGPLPKPDGEGKPKSQARSLIAFDTESGNVAWEGGERQISYASPSIATLGGVRQIVIVNEDTVTGNEVATGKELWSHPWPGGSNGPASSSQAQVVTSERLLLSKGYGNGAELIAVKQAGGKWQVTSLQKNPRVLKTKFTNVTLIGPYAYGLSDGVLECVELSSLRPAWKRGRFGHGQVLGVGDKILVLGEGGVLALVEANPEKYVELGRLQVFTGKTWNNLCLTGKRLLIRNGEEAACYELP